MIGTIISHYRILEKLGEGSVGVVYKAEDLTLGLAVAIKLLHPERSANNSAVLGFQHEARIASRRSRGSLIRIRRAPGRRERCSRKVSSNRATGTTSATPRSALSCRPH